MDCNRNRLPIKRKKNVKKLCDSNIYQYLCTIKKKRKGKNMNRMINVAIILKKEAQYFEFFSNDGGCCLF